MFHKKTLFEAGRNGPETAPTRFFLPDDERRTQMAENEILQSTAVDENNDYNASEIQVFEGLEAVR